MKFRLSSRSRDFNRWFLAVALVQGLVVASPGSLLAQGAAPATTATPAAGQPRPPGLPLRRVSALNHSSFAFSLPHSRLRVLMADDGGILLVDHAYGLRALLHLPATSSQFAAAAAQVLIAVAASGLPTRT